MQVIDFLHKENTVEKDIKLKDVKFSSLQRLLTDPDFRWVAGIETKDEKVRTKYEPTILFQYSKYLGKWS